MRILTCLSNMELTLCVVKMLMFHHRCPFIPLSAGNFCISRTENDELQSGLYRD